MGRKGGTVRETGAGCADYSDSTSLGRWCEEECAICRDYRSERWRDVTVTVGSWCWGLDDVMVKARLTVRCVLVE